MIRISSVESINGKEYQVVCESQIESPEVVVACHAATTKKLHEAYQTPALPSVWELDVCVRTRSVLVRSGIKTMADLLAKTPEDLRAVRDCGDRALNEIVAALKALGLSLRG